MDIKTCQKENHHAQIELKGKQYFFYIKLYEVCNCEAIYRPSEVKAICVEVSNGESKENVTISKGLKKNTVNGHGQFIYKNSRAQRTGIQKYQSY